MSKAIIAIPTFRRPSGLHQLLTSLAELSTSHDVRVIVGDNDSMYQDGLNTVERFQSLGYRWPIDSILVETRGISQVRNALINASLSDESAKYVLMLDDDEIADPWWLDEMIQMQLTTGADIVGGRINRLSDGRKPDWADEVAFLSNKVRSVSGTVDLVDSTGNLLFARTCLERAGRPIFDLAFGITGGEDKEALTRLKRAGVSFAWSESATVSEQIAASRLSREWVLQRAFRIGNTDMRVLLRHRQSRVEVATEGIKALLVLACAPLLILRAGRNEIKGMRARMMIWRAGGKMAAFAGINYREYLVTHGK